MKVLRRLILVVAALIVVTLGLRFVGGYAFTPRGALGSMPIHKQRDTTLFDDLNFGWAHVYLVKTKVGYETAIVKRRGVFWHLLGTAVIQKSSDPVQTVGWASVYGANHELAVFAVKVTDPQVKSIEAGPLSEVQKKDISPGQLVVFSWDNTSLSGDYKASALSDSGKELYRFGYPQKSMLVSSSVLQWYPVS